MIQLKNMLEPNTKELRQSWEQALHDKAFQVFLERLAIPEAMAMKYTSQLQESCEEYQHCLSCSALGECKNKVLGHVYLPKIVGQGLQFHYKPCRYQMKQEKQYHYLKNVKYYFVPKAFEEASFDKIDKRIVKRNDAILWLHTFSNNPTGKKGLYLSGNFGCGKTYLIVATLNELAKKNIKSAVVFWPEFLRDLKASFDTNYDQKMEYIKHVELLLIDDIGAEAVTTWARDEILCSILQYRMDANLTTFFTSNFTMEELESHLASTKEGVELVKAKRIMERIKQLSEEMIIISRNMRK